MKKRLIRMGERRKKHSNLDAVLGCVWLKLSSSVSVRYAQRGKQNPAASLPSMWNWPAGTHLCLASSPPTAWEAAGLGQCRHVWGRGSQVQSEATPGYA